MALIELEYEERVGGLLYPIIDMGQDRLEQLGKFGNARLNYLHSEKFEFYRELLFTGKLAEHCEQIDEIGNSLHEKMFQYYLGREEIPLDDFYERVAIFNAASRYSDEIVFYEYIYS